MIKNAIWLFIIATAVLFIFLPSYTRMQDLRHKNAVYQDQIEQLRVKNEQLKEEMHRLKEDPVYLEKVGREKMGLIKKGEVIFQVETEEKE